MTKSLISWKKRPANTGRLFITMAVVMWLSFLLWSPGVSESFCQAAADGSEIRWYSIRLGEEMVGYIKETGSRLQQDGRWFWKSVTESRFFIRRLGQKVEMSVNYEHLETEDGLLKKVSAEQVLAGSRVRTELVVEGDKIRIKTISPSQSFSREIPYSGQLLGPVGISRLAADRLKKPGDSVEYQTILAELARVISGERTLVGEEMVDCGQNRTAARKVVDSLASIEITRQVWLDTEGNEIKAVEPSPLGDLVTCLSSEQEIRETMAVAGGRDQFFQSSLIRANVRLPQARGLDRVIIRLKHTRPERGWPEIENEYQRIINRDDNSLVLELRRVPPGTDPSGRLTLEEQRSCLGASAYIDANAPEIRRVALEVAGREKNALNKALKLRDWVSRNLTFDSGFVFAPASEVMRDKKATCAGYATLLAAMLRAAGLPSRYVMGIVYANGIWGGHAWVEAWVAGRWVPLDAALPSPGSADPARLAIARSSLDDGPGESLMAVQKIFGQVTIEVLEFSLRGQSFRVPENQPLYEVRDNRYWNPGLMVGLRVPDGFTLAELDRVWPDRTLMALLGPDEQTVRILQEGWAPVENLDNYLLERLKKEVAGGRPVYLPVWGKRRPALVSVEKSALAILRGTDLFVVVATGKNSRQLLQQVAAGLENKLAGD